jgi:FkbM family methyltransferase
MDVPIIIICYNNYKYVEHMSNQILKINEAYYKNITILDNCSTCVDTKNYLNTVNVNVITNLKNTGPWISPYDNTDLYNQLPNKFILTDADLELHEQLPANFVEILANLSDKYQTSKIGFALHISDYEDMFQIRTYVDNKSIYEHEIGFWTNNINDVNYELYYAAIDTTFCLIDKTYTLDEDCNNNCVRIAGVFTAKHLPWYTNNKIYNVYENYKLCASVSNISTIANVVHDYTMQNYSKITKNNEIFFIDKTQNDPNLHFWENVYTNWEHETFDTFDKLLDPNKVFIDIGGWIGTTSMYSSRNSKHVYSIEADNQSFIDMSKNLKINCKNNYTLINKAIYNVDNIELHFGKNKFLNNSIMNDSTSQIYDADDNTCDCCSVMSCTIQSIISQHHINPQDISLIKVDIEGGEEYILRDLHLIHSIYNVPLYIRFHYDWWKDKNLDKFSFLTDKHKHDITNCPFISILFN